MKNLILNSAHPAPVGNVSMPIPSEAIQTQIEEQNIKLAALLVHALFTPLERRRLATGSSRFQSQLCK